jgi:hypothetical protein
MVNGPFLRPLFGTSLRMSQALRQTYDSTATIRSYTAPTETKAPPLPRCGPIPTIKTREAEAALAKRPPWETTYQGAYCRSYDQPLLPLLSRQSSTAPETYKCRDLGEMAPAARKKVFQTTYQADFCTPFPQQVLAYSSSTKTYPQFRAIAGTTTHTAPKLREQDRAPRETATRAANFTVSRGGWTQAAPDGRWEPDK